MVEAYPVVPGPSISGVRFGEAETDRRTGLIGSCRIPSEVLRRTWWLPYARFVTADDANSSSAAARGESQYGPSMGGVSSKYHIWADLGQRDKPQLVNSRGRHG